MSKAIVVACRVLCALGHDITTFTTGSDGASRREGVRELVAWNRRKKRRFKLDRKPNQHIEVSWRTICFKGLSLLCFKTLTGDVKDLFGKGLDLSSIRQKLFTTFPKLLISKQRGETRERPIKQKLTNCRHLVFDRIHNNS